MYNPVVSKYDFLSSKFTRKRGFTNITGSISLSRKKAISILNSFTPQGASPAHSIRIGSFNDMVGAGYYSMEDESTANLYTVLSLNNEDKYLPFIPSLNLSDIENISIGKFNLNKITSYNSMDSLDLNNIFGVERTSNILYSLLSGDNLIIVEPSHDKRLAFMRTLLMMVPRVSLKYNRLTSDCFELDGNENIIGVDQLPRKFRSHKKLYLPVDTIFVDLEQGQIEGNGIKNSSLTKKIILNNQFDISKILVETSQLYKKIIENNYIPKEDETNKSLVNRMRYKLGIDKEFKENWLMEF